MDRLAQSLGEMAAKSEAAAQGHPPTPHICKHEAGPVTFHSMLGLQNQQILLKKKIKKKN